MTPAAQPTWRRDPAILATIAAVACACIVYGPAIGYGLVNYDDPWLVEQNWILAHPSASSLHKIWLDFDPQTRFVLGSEYLPVRDLSILVDRALWDDWYGGFHLTNLVVYAAAIVVWSRALIAWGIEARVAAIALLVWAVLPVHAESVAWVTERKGLLAALFAGVAALGLGHFRSGRAVGWVVLGGIAGMLAVWSKAPAAFALAALGGLELVLPARRVTWKRSVVGLAAIALPAALAFAPVLLVAMRAEIVGAGDQAPAGHVAMALGLHGFYVRPAAMTLPHAVTYPIATLGPSIVDLVVGGVSLVAALAVLVVKPRGVWQPSAALRAGCMLWLVNWFPISRLVLPLQVIFVADRYLLLPSLGFALVVAVLASSITSVAIRRLLLVAIVLAGVLRSLDARENWEHDTALWRRAVASNPHDGSAWANYVQALLDDGDPEARVALDRGLALSRAPELLLRAAMFAEQQDPDRAMAFLEEAAHAGNGQAATSLATLLLAKGQTADALVWARRAAKEMPMRAYVHRTHGKVATAANVLDEAVGAFELAHELDPDNPTGRYELGLAYAKAGRVEVARPLFESITAHPVLGPDARAALERLR